MQYILRFEQCAKDLVDRVGGKCASLGSLIAAGAPVPPGFVVTTEAWRAMLEYQGLGRCIFAEMRDLGSSGESRLPEVCERARTLIETAPMDPAMEEAILKALEELRERCGGVDVPVAVRSSATAEDLPSASFAGLHDTALWILGASDVLQHIRRCWSSLYTARAVAYRLDRRFQHEKVFMAVGVQKMVKAKAAGVAFTLNPENGDRSKIAIEANFGLGESVVSGEVTPDHFLIDKVIFKVVKRVISPKHMEYAFDAAQGFVVPREISPERRTEPCLTQDEVIAVAKLAKYAETHFRSPQDVEWAIDGDLPPEESVVLLQSRPETVWSRKPPVSVTTSHSRGMAGMVHTLLHGQRVGGKR